MAFSITASDPALVTAVPNFQVPAFPFELRLGKVQTQSFKQDFPRHELDPLQYSSLQWQFVLVLARHCGGWHVHNGAPCLQ